MSDDVPFDPVEADPPPPPDDKHQDPPDPDGTVAPGEGVAGSRPRPTGKLGTPPDDWKPTGTGKLAEQYDELIRKRGKDRLWFPHLLIRAHPGDTGARPCWTPQPSWLSPDIHLFEVGPGGGTPGVDLSRSVASPQVGSSYVVGVHVWNLGRFPAHGVMVKAWWVEPGFFTGTADPRYAPHYIGGVWTELGDRDSGHAHGVVTLPTPWKVQDTGMLHQCLLATVECAADPSAGGLDANADRHVGQRNLSLVAAADDLTGLMKALHERLDEKQTIRISAAGAKHASLSGARRRGFAGDGDGGGGWPLRMNKPRTVATITKEGGTMAVRVGKESRQVRWLGEAVQLALGARGLSGKELMAGTVVAGLGGSAVVHIGTEVSGYSLAFQA